MTSSCSLATEVDRLAQLTLYVDGLSAAPRLSRHPGLRAQMRRSAMDAISHAACAAEATSSEECRRLVQRTLSALGELETMTRMAVARGALDPAEAGRIAAMARQAALALRLLGHSPSREAKSEATARTHVPPLSGAA